MMEHTFWNELAALYFVLCPSHYCFAWILDRCTTVELPEHNNTDHNLTPFTTALFTTAGTPDSFISVDNIITLVVAKLFDHNWHARSVYLYKIATMHWFTESLDSEYSVSIIIPPKANNHTQSMENQTKAMVLAIVQRTWPRSIPSGKVTGHTMVIN
jgi:hypothetical protein